MTYPRSHTISLKMETPYSSGTLLSAHKNTLRWNKKHSAVIPQTFVLHPECCSCLRIWLNGCLIAPYLSVYLSLSVYLPIYLSIYLSVCLSIYLSIYLSICLSMALQPFVGPWPLFLFLDLFMQSVGLLGQGMNPSQCRYLRTGQHKHRINPHRHPCLKWDSNPRSQCLSGWRHSMAQTAGTLWSVPPLIRALKSEQSFCR
jgi:hypothetical protein